MPATTTGMKARHVAMFVCRPPACIVVCLLFVIVIIIREEYKNAIHTYSTENLGKYCSIINSVFYCEQSWWVFARPAGSQRVAISFVSCDFFVVLLAIVCLHICGAKNYMGFATLQLALPDAFVVLSVMPSVMMMEASKKKKNTMSGASFSAQQHSSEEKTEAQTGNDYDYS